MRVDRILAALSLGALLAACAGTLDSPESYDPAYCTDVAKVPTAIIAPRCATDGCHDGSPIAAAGLDFKSPGLHMRLEGKPAMGGPGVLLDSANPQSSVLYMKTGKAAPFGYLMPLGRTPLDDSDRACLLAWIGSGT